MVIVLRMQLSRLCLGTQIPKSGSPENAKKPDVCETSLRDLDAQQKIYAFLAFGANNLLISFVTIPARPRTVKTNHVKAIFTSGISAEQSLDLHKGYRTPNDQIVLASYNNNCRQVLPDA